MSVVLDPNRGFCFVAEKPAELPKSRSNGFDVLDWESHLPLAAAKDDVLPNIDDSVLDHETPAKNLKFTRSERKQIKKKAAALKRRLRSSNGADQSPIADLGVDAYTSKQRIRKLHQLVAGTGGDCKIFDFGSIAFYKSDADYIVPGEWLNDNNISFVYEALSTYFVKPHPFGFQVYMLFPALVQLFLHYPVVEDVKSILPLKDLAKSKFVFIPFNFIDESDLADLEDANSGDHWALCVLSIAEKKLYVYDSMTFDDDEEDDTLLLQLATRLQAALFKKSDTLKIVKMKCGQQSNFDDCGVYLVMFSCFLLSMLMSGKNTDLDISKVDFDPLAGRVSMMELVYKLTVAERKV